ncbi:DUF2637 domain-containing protein [Streptomyces sp. NPDC054835]
METYPPRLNGHARPADPGSVAPSARPVADADKTVAAPALPARPVVPGGPGTTGVPGPGETAGMQDLTTIPVPSPTSATPSGTRSSASGTPSGSSGARRSPSPTPAASSQTPSAGSGTDGEPGRVSRHLWLMIPLVVITVVAGLAAAVTGFALSYGALRDAAVSWGYLGWKSYAFPIGIDGLIIALYTADLVLAWRRMTRPWVRMTAHVLTGVTIALNVSAAAAGLPGAPDVWAAFDQSPGRMLGHAMMPIAYVILTEVARWAIVRTARLESGQADEQRLTLAEWTLNFRVTWKIFQYAKTYPATYAEARSFIREVRIYRVWQQVRPRYTGTVEQRAAVVDAMPALLAPYGVSVEDARAMPGRMLATERRLEEEQRLADQKRKDETERKAREEELAAQRAQREKEERAREDAHQAQMDKLRKQAEVARQEGELAELQATVDGQSKAAVHRAKAVVATAEIQATSAASEAQRSAEVAARLATAEDEAQAAEAEAKAAREKAEKAAALAKAEQDKRAAAEAEAKRIETEAKLAEQKAREAAEKAKAAEQTGRQAAALAQAERDREAAAEAEAKRIEAEATLARARALEETERAKATEAEARAVEADRKKTEESAKLAQAQAAEKAGLAQAAEADRKIAEEMARTERARHAAAQSAYRAAEAEALAGMQARALKVRVVARMLIDSVPAEHIAGKSPQDLAKDLKNAPVTNAAIAAAIGISSPGTASEYKTDALELIRRGYHHHTGTDPDIATQQ